MPRSADVAVLGLGAMGSAAALSLARQGLRTVGLDRHHPPHTLGSTHGRSRIIRQAYYESPAYVPLVRRAWELWRALERDAGRNLLTQTGGLMIGPASGQLVEGARQSAERHGLPYQDLSGADVRRRYPALHPEEGTVALYEAQAGFLDPEECVSAALRLAAEAGADLRFGTSVSGWEARAGHLRLDTSNGAVEAGHLVLAAGPWLPELPGMARWRLAVERQVMHWFRPRARPELFAPDRLPVFVWEWAAGRFFYGIPDHGQGLKLAQHHEGVLTSADSVSRLVAAAETEAIRGLAGRFLPDADGPPVEQAVCLYTNTPDHHFLLGALPAEPRVIVVSACSGHGFKFAPAIGEAVAELVSGGRTRVELGSFAPSRMPAS